MAGFKALAFKGRYPGVDSRIIPENAGTVATNLKLGYGDIKPLHGYEDQSTPLTDRGQPRSLFLYREKWLHFGTTAHFVTAPAGQDAWSRIVFSIDEYEAGSEPAVRVSGDIPPDGTTSEVTNGSGPYPDSWMALGVPIPAAAPIITSGNATGDVEDLRTVYYCMTYVNDRGEESAPSIPSTAVDILESAYSVDLSIGSFDVSQSSGDTDGLLFRTITHVRIYRLYAQDATQTWLFVDEVTANTTTYTDTTPTSELDGDSLVTFGWNPPPVGLKGLRMLPNGAVVGFKDDEVVFSEPWYPYAYPVRYRYKVDWPIVGLGVFGSSVAVFTTAQPYIAQGVHPAEMVLTRLEADQSCVSARSIVDFGDRVIWAAPDGLFSVGTNGVEAITGSFMDKRTWRADFSPSTIHAYAYEGLYVAFYGNSAGFIVNPFNPQDGLIDLDDYAYAGFRDMETDTLYLAMDDGVGGYGVFAFDSDAANPLTWTWRSRVVEFPAHVSLGRAQVIGTGYTAGAFSFSSYYLDDFGVLTLRDDGYAVTSRNPVTLRSGTLMTDWLFEVSGTQECEALIVGETIRDIRSN